MQTISSTGGIQITGTASDVIVGIASAGTITTQVINASGTGTNRSTFGVTPRVGGVYTPPTDPQDLAVKQYVDNTAGSYLPLAGGVMTGSINMGLQQITGASSVSTTALVLNSQPITLGQQGAGATVSQNAYFKTTGGAITALASYLYKVPGAISSVPVYPAYNGENWIFPSGGASIGFTMFVNTTATSNAFSLPAGFYIRFINRKASSLALTVSSVVNPLIPVGAVNTPLTLAASRDTYIYWNGTTWTAD